MRVTALFLALLLGLSGVSLSACNTVQGLGQDIESVGKAGEEAMD
ncbi:MAG: entericidin A/B family lipoprotein [Alphaproteobacteria bacterium]|nr:entericidin A/B family lipoprotein [Alphaproteobacteria bacterium]